MKYSFFSRVLKLNVLPCVWLFIASATQAQAAQPFWSFSGYVDYLALDEEVAAYNGLGDSAFALGVTADYHLGNTWIIAGSFGLAGFDDQAEFSQRVRSNFGDESTESSSVSGMQFAASVGKAFEFAQMPGVIWTPKLGFMNYFGTDRSISNCSDCFEEEIDISGGVYAALALDKKGKGFGTELQWHLSGDQKIGLRLQYRF